MCVVFPPGAAQTSQHPHSRPGVGQEAHRLGGFSLHLAQPLAELRQLSRRGRSAQTYRQRRPRPGPGIDAAGAQALHQRVPGDLPAVGPQHQRCLFVVGFHEPPALPAAELLPPHVDEPRRVGNQGGQIQGVPGCRGRGPCVPFPARDLPQDRVDQPRLSRPGAPLGEFHQLVDGGVGRHPVQEEQLVAAQPKQVADQRIQVLEGVSEADGASTQSMRPRQRRTP